VLVLKIVESWDRWLAAVWEGRGGMGKKGSNKSNIDYLASENHIDGGRSRCLRLVNKRDPFIGQKQGLKI
jgi:hypothetical protein